METRYAIFHKGKNLFKDNRSFKTKAYAEKKAREIIEGMALMNQQISLKVISVQIETELDRYKKALEYAINCMQSEYRSQLRFDAEKRKINQILGKEEGEK